MTETLPIKGYSLEGIQQFLLNQGYPKFRAKQLIQWIYQKNVSSYDEMTNLPAAMREDLKEKAPLYKPTISNKQVSKDGTRKYVIRFYDGAEAEMVAIPSSGRLTVCFSTQVGCPMACIFCATGQEGFTRNLLPGEIVDQVLIAQEDMGMRVSNLVGMGQGEPFLNYDNVVAALHILNGKEGLEIAARKITISTCGILSGIEKFAQEPEQFTMAISLHSAIQETRDKLIPKMRNANLIELRNAVASYCKKSNRRVTFEYLLAKDINDDDEHLQALIKYCRGLLCHVNIIPLNSVEGSPLQPSSGNRTKKFLEGLQEAGIEATIRDSRGSDIAGACGQLKNSYR